MTSAGLTDLDTHPAWSLGVDQFVCMMQLGQIPHAKILDSLRHYGKEIIPHFKGAEARLASVV